jgi:hypothetical protein
VTTAAAVDARALADLFVTYLETGEAARGLYAPDVFLDVTLPRWRTQAQGDQDAIALRRARHPEPGRVSRLRYDPTPTGFVLELEETWVDAAGEPWYCREMFRADVGPEGITQLSVYCTGDWDTARIAEHRAAESLIRP